MRTGTDENNSTLISLAYDTLSRLYTVTTPVQQTTYSYTPGATTGTTTTLVSQMSLGKVNSNSFAPVTFGYEYDVVGNISKITESGVGYTDYTYDTVNQLLSAKDYNTAGTLVKEYTYTYDTYGNIRTASDGTTSHTYTYGDSEWLDLLTAYDGNTITYDVSGNPLTYHDGTTFTWRNGRELATLTKNGQTISYAYDQGGVRTTKTAGSVTHKYYYASGKLLRETWTQDNTAYVLDFLYNQNGSPYALKYTAGTAAAVTYYYVLNLQGDVICLVDSTGATVANYDYDPWGKVLAVTDANGNAITSTTHIANLNPLRYRGYYYDAETGFYYLQSRYYDPSIGRFINADSYASTGVSYLGFNMFAYCNNNPVNMVDSAGQFPLTLAELRLIHNKVAFLVAIKVGGVTEVWVQNTVEEKTVYGRLDIYVPADDIYYEVKPAHLEFASRTINQMIKYDGATPVSSRYSHAGPVSRGPKRDDVSGRFYYHGWKVEYEMLADGLVGYKLTAPEVDEQAAVSTLVTISTAVVIGSLLNAAGGGAKVKAAYNLVDTQCSLS